MKAETVAAIGALVDRNTDLLPVLEEHLVDNDGAVLPHLVMADVVRWMVSHETSHPDVCRSILAWMEERIRTGPDDVRGLVVLSGVEMIPDPGEPGSTLRELLGPSLRALDPWQ